MRELLRTNDLIYLSFVQAQLQSAGIPFHVLDSFTSNAEGQISAIPRRLMVRSEDFEDASELVEEATKALDCQ